MVIRVTYNISDKDGDTGGMSFRDFVQACGEKFITQVSIRKLTIPERIQKNRESKNTADWIRKHGNESLYARWTGELLSAGPRIIRELPFGAMVYDWMGVSITHFDYCIQERNMDFDIRSLVYQEDGHLYTSWDSSSSIIL